MKKLAIVLVIVIATPIATGYWYVSRFSVTTDSGIRMSPLLVTRETIRQDLLADDRFDSTEARCDLYQRMFKGASSSVEDMVSLGCD